MNAATLPLRDVHLPPAPGWWPPAAGWWWLAGLLLVSLAMLGWGWRRRRLRRRAWQARFDAELGPAGDVPARLAAASSLLRRAARRVDPRADRLQGEDWLRFLDGRRGRDFSQGAGRLLLDGGFRPQVPEALAAPALALARARFVALMEGRR